MKKYLYNIVLATLILMSTTVVKASNEVYYINNENVEMTEEEYNNLLSLGFSEKYISGMDQEEFINNKDIEGTLLAETQKYIKTSTVVRNGIKTTTTEEISREEAMKEKELQSQNVPNRGPAGNYYDGMTYTSTISLTTKIVGISNSTMRYVNNMEWITIPTDRYRDIIGIGMEASKVQMSSLIAFKEEWVTSDGTPSHTKVCAPVYLSTGGLAIFDLPSGSLQSLEATLYYNVTKQSGVGTITSLYATGDYAHAISNISANTLVSNVLINVNGLSINYPYTYDFLSISPTVASFIGTW